MTTTQNTDPRFLPDFDAYASFESPQEALDLIEKQPDQEAALLAIIEANIHFGEFGFATEVLADYQTIELVEPPEPPKVPTPAEIYGDPCASYWLKDALATALERDPLDALRDAKTLLAVIKEWELDTTCYSLAKPTPGPMRDIVIEFKVTGLDGRVFPSVSMPREVCYDSKDWANLHEGVADETPNVCFYDEGENRSLGTARPVTYWNALIRTNKSDEFWINYLDSLEDPATATMQP